MTSPPAVTDEPAFRRLARMGALRRAGYAVGVLLLAGAVFMVWRQRDTVGDALAALGRPDPVLVAVLVGAILVNISLSAVFTRLLLNRYGHVGMLEAHALMAGASLLNFLPLRAGLWGRMAYHSAMHDIRAVDTAKTVVQGLVISVVVMLVIIAVIAVTMTTRANLAVATAVPLGGLVVASTVPRWRPWAPAAAVRYAEALVWAVRYDVAFRLLGHPIEPAVAVAFACTSMLATLVPFVSNGLGLREWAIGLLAPVLGAAPMELGVTAELVNRAAEILVLLATGLVSIAWLARRHRGRPDGGQPDTPRSAAVNRASKR